MRYKKVGRRPRWHADKIRETDASHPPQHKRCGNHQHQNPYLSPPTTKELAHRPLNSLTEPESAPETEFRIHKMSIANGLIYRTDSLGIKLAGPNLPGIQS